MSKPEIYVSIDIETNGPAPGVHSMLALGCAAFSLDGDMTDTFYVKLEPLHEAIEDTKTMDWWTTQPQAWAEVITDRWPAPMAMAKFRDWCAGLATQGKLVAVAWPAAFDFAFVNYYCHRFLWKNPLGFACLDIRSYANGLAGYASYYGLPEQLIRTMAGEVDTEGLRPHVAVDDAIEQGRLFMALRRYAMTRA